MFAVSLAKSEGAALLLLDPAALSSHHIPTETNNIVHDQLQSQGFKHCYKDIHMIMQR